MYLQRRNKIAGYSVARGAKFGRGGGKRERELYVRDEQAVARRSNLRLKRATVNIPVAPALINSSRTDFLDLLVSGLHPEVSPLVVVDECGTHLSIVTGVEAGIRRRAAVQAAVAVGGLRVLDDDWVVGRGGVFAVVGRWTFKLRWAPLRAF